ncbi:MAG: helix-turn-helix transcriptional regulator [Clostridiales bacterium]|nr:helix-turn-helix transcriptional regulator [Candidatus Crickella equi]
MENRGISIYALEYDYGLNPAEISRLKNNHNFTVKSINKLCVLFDMRPEEIMDFVKTDKDEDLYARY